MTTKFTYEEVLLERDGWEVIYAQSNNFAVTVPVEQKESEDHSPAGSPQPVLAYPDDIEHSDATPKARKKRTRVTDTRFCEYVNDHLAAAVPSKAIDQIDEGVPVDVGYRACKLEEARAILEMHGLLIRDEFWKQPLKDLLHDICKRWVSSEHPRH